MAPRRDLAAALLAALRAGCPDAPPWAAEGNRLQPAAEMPDQGLAPSVAPVAPVAPVEWPDGDGAERAAIIAEADMPPRCPDAQHRAMLAGLLAAARLRPAFWPGADAVPAAGAVCAACGGMRFRRDHARRGWRCAACRPAPGPI